MAAIWIENDRELAREGALVVAPYPAQIVSRYADGAIRVGLLVERSDEAYNQVMPMAALPAVDPNHIVATPLPSAVTQEDYGFATFDGINTTQRIHPPQRLSFTLNADADWLDSVMQVRFENPSGGQVTEDILIPAGGGAPLLYTKAPASLLEIVSLPIGGGAAGTMLVGTDPDVYGIDRRGYPGIALYDRVGEPSATDTVTIDDEEPVSLLTKGWVWVIVEAAVEHGMPAYVRMVEVGNDVRGQWRGSPAANFCRVPGASFITSQTAVDGLATLEIGG